MVNYLIPWLVFIIPIIGALLLPFISRFGNQIRDYTAIGISFLSAILALLMMPFCVHATVIIRSVDLILTRSHRYKFVGTNLFARYQLKIEIHFLNVKPHQTTPFFVYNIIAY